MASHACCGVVSNGCCGCLGTERGSVQSIGCAAPAAETRHRLHELRGRTIRTVRGCAGRIGSETAELPIESNLAETAGAAQRIIGVLGAFARAVLQGRGPPRAREAAMRRIMMALALVAATLTPAATGGAFTDPRAAIEVGQ